MIASENIIIQKSANDCTVKLPVCISWSIIEWVKDDNRCWSIINWRLTPIDTRQNLVVMVNIGMVR